MAADRRLLTPVQQAVRDLEPALLRLVQNDPRFFNDKQHPTRQLLSEMTQRSLAWSARTRPDSPSSSNRCGKPSMRWRPCRSRTPILSNLPCSRSGKPGPSRKSAVPPRARAGQCPDQAEKRNLAAAKIADAILSRQDISAASGEIRRFVLGPWTQVMAAAQLADGSGAADPGGYGAIINDLIWTTQPRLAAQNPNRLAQLVPPILQTLRHGLASIGYPADATRQLLDHLHEQHQMALRPATPAAAPAPVARRVGSPMGQGAGPAGGVAGAVGARDSGLMDLLPDTAPDWKDTVGPDGVDTQPMDSGSIDGPGRRALATRRLGRCLHGRRLVALATDMGQPAFADVHVHRRRGQAPVDDAHRAGQDDCRSGPCASCPSRPCWKARWTPWPIRHCATA